MEFKTNYRQNVRYELMLGREATEALAHYPVAYLPIGCLERHGDHLPMGLDVIKAHKICCIAAQTLGGIVYPPHFYSGIHEMTPEQMKRNTAEWGNLYTNATAKATLMDLISQMEIGGVKVLVLYSGHYARAQVDMIKVIADEVNARGGIVVLPLTEPYILKGDHAGFSETSLMLYLDKSLVDMTRISTVNYRDHGWTEANTPEKASHAEGEAEIEKILAHLQKEAERCLKEARERGRG
ncbi:MAG: creatininase family protein [bacterium]|nr:creatininase family protein [bacterium]